MEKYNIRKFFSANPGWHVPLKVLNVSSLSICRSPAAWSVWPPLRIAGFGDLIAVSYLCSNL